MCVYEKNHSKSVFYPVIYLQSSQHSNAERYQNISTIHKKKNLLRIKILVAETQ